MFRGGLFALILLALLPGLTAARADGRVALVIGNGAYQNVPILANPVNDAGDIAASLQRLDFDVKILSNAKYDEMRRALIGFGQQARGAEFAVIFFAGHGMEIGGENWLIPVDAQLAADADVPGESIGLQFLMRSVSNAGKLGLVILDACRNNPFLQKMQRTNMTRATERGFVRVEPNDNILVAYAARDGTTASDGGGRNSPFTQALLKNLETPGLEVRFLFANVKDDVMAATNRKQQPYTYGSLSKDLIYFRPPAGASSEPSKAPPADPAAQAWAAAQNTGSVEVLEEFIRMFGDSFYASLARARLAELKKQQQAALVVPPPAASQAAPSNLVAAPPPPSTPAKTNLGKPAQKYQLIWERTYAIAGTDVALYGMLPLKNGDILMQAQSKLAKFDTYCSAVTRVKGDGTLLWMKYPDPRQCDGVFRFRALDDENLMVVGQRSNKDLKDRSIAFRLSNDGKATSTRVLPKVTIWGLSDLADRTLLTVGREEVTSNSYSGWARLLNADGALGREVRIGEPNLQREFRRVLNLDDGGFLVGGATSSGSDWRAWLVRLDRNLSVIWEKIFDIGQSHSDSLHKLNENTYLVIVGASDDVATAIAVDPSGTIKWRKKLPDMKYPICVHVGADGCQLASYQVEPKASVSVGQLSADGDVSDIETLSFGVGREPAEIVALPGGDLLISGSSNSNRMGWLARYTPIIPLSAGNTAVPSGK